MTLKKWVNNSGTVFEWTMVAADNNNHSKEKGRHWSQNEIFTLQCLPSNFGFRKIDEN